MTELRKCPFCNGEAKIYKRQFDWATYDYKIECIKCHCETDVYDTKQEAIDAWNKRVSCDVCLRSLTDKEAVE